MKAKMLKTLLAGAVMAALATSAVYAEEAVSEAAEEAVTEAAAEEEEEDTGDASLDDLRNQDEIGANEIQVVSFGTSYNDSRRETIGAIEGAIEEAFPDWSVRRGFTSDIIIDHVESRDGIHIDSLQEALDRAVDNGVKNLVVQPTHVMAGFEYTDVENLLAEYADAFENLALGVNLLNTDEDYETVVTALTDAMAEYDDGKTAIVLMGHGTEAESNATYAKLQDVLAADGFENYYVGTVEAEPSLDDVLAAIADKGYEKVVLRDFMVVAGDHAHNDMADPEDPESWYSAFTAAGYDVTAVLEGLGQIPAVRDLYVAHTQETVDSIAE